MASDFQRPSSFILSPTMFWLSKAVAPVARSALAAKGAGEACVGDAKEA